jgi:hypothetical protein
MDHNRLSCFLAYNRSYEKAMTRVRDLLDILDVDVRVFDDPDTRPLAAVIQSDIQKADFVVVLLGPDLEASEATSEPARWPAEEAVIAHVQGKPTALIVHPGTHLPGVLEADQTPARFDFRSDESYADHVHHILQHLLNTIRTVRLPPGDNPYYFEHVAFTFTIDRRENVTFVVYHQLIARERWTRVAHCVDSGLDLTDAAQIVLLNEDDVDLAVTTGSTEPDPSLIWGEATPHARHYTIRFDPPVPKGARVGYSRTFELENYFPITAEELAARSREDRFPSVFRQGGVLYYGTSFDVTSEIQTLSVTFELPAKMVVRSFRAVALHLRTGDVNETETTRISLGDALTMDRSQQSGVTTLALSVVRPVSGHRYLLLYEPGNRHAS